MNQKLLETSDGSGGYKVGIHQQFRVPVLMQGPMPALSSDSPRTTLSPTTICVNAILDERGEVSRVDVLDDRAECHRGATSEYEDLLLAVRERLKTWKYSPAAICTWKSQFQTLSVGDCIAADTVIPVPVTLSYSFTFEIREGRTVVRQGQ